MENLNILFIESSKVYFVIIFWNIISGDLHNNIVEYSSLSSKKSEVKTFRPLSSKCTYLSNSEKKEKFY